MVSKTWGFILAVGACAAWSATPSLAKEKEYEWGSISIDATQSSKTPHYGIGGGDTETEAVKNSQKFCVEDGGKGCKSFVTYEACGAFASNGGDAGWGKAPTKAAAEKGAMKSCGKDDCVLVTSDCN